MSVSDSRDDCQHPVERIQIQADEIFIGLWVRDLHIDHALVFAAEVRTFQEQPGTLCVGLGHPSVVKAINWAEFDPNAGKYVQPEDELNCGRQDISHQFSSFRIIDGTVSDHGFVGESNVVSAENP